MANAGQVEDSRADSFIARIALAEALVNGGRRFRAPGVLKTDDRIQELPVGYAACQPFIEQIGYSIALGSNKLAEYEQIRCRIMEILPPHRKECGIPGEVAAIQIPRKTVQVPFLELISALLDKLGPALVV